MSVKIRMHPFFQHLVDGQETIEVEGKNVGQCLTSLVSRFPGLKAELFDKRGQLRSYIEIYLNNESTYPEELNHRVADGDELSIVVMAVGG
ncbi:MAG: MoaD/ThiS family protein [Clostridia bacterium]|nr:MoaD/ThiS family protein [Clostridia bacterium]